MAIARRVDPTTQQEQLDDDPFGGQGGFGAGGGDPLSDILAQFGSPVAIPTDPGQLPDSGGIASSESPRERDRRTPNVILQPHVDTSDFGMTQSAPQMPRAPSPAASRGGPANVESPAPMENTSGTRGVFDELMQTLSGESPKLTRAPMAPTSQPPQVLSERSSGLLGRGGGAFSGGIGIRTPSGGRGQSTLTRTLKRFMS